MEQHIAVLGFLLSATVFSVGFLSARIHASLDTCEVEVNEQSWRIRDALLRRERMSPANLQSSLSVLRRSRDTVSILTRIINGLLFAATAGLAVDAYMLMGEGVAAPEHALLLIVTVFTGSAAVTLIGEFDARKVARDQRVMLEKSLPGQINRLGVALSAKRYAVVDQRVAELLDGFPDWGLLEEIRAYSRLRQGQAGEAYDMVRDLIARSEDLYLSHVVGTAAAMARGDGLAALRILDAVERRAPHLSGIAELKRAVTLYLGHLPAVLEEPRALPAVPTGGANRLDLDVHEVPETARLFRILDAWQSNGSVATFVKEAEGSPLLLAVRSLLREAGPAASGDHADLEPGVLETLGMVALATGDPREALRILERAVRLAPAASRVHWGVAIASHRIGWTSAAAAALNRAETLVSHAPIVPLTRDVFTNSTVPQPRAVAAEFRSGIGALDRLQLAMLGVPPATPVDRSVVAGQFVGALLDAAVRTATEALRDERVTA